MEWADIPDFPNYQVSNCGQVKNTKFNRVLSISRSDRGFSIYHRVTLFRNGVRHYKQIHRLVAEAFIPNPNKLPQVDHIDNDGQNNHVSNLQWISASDNVQKSFTQNADHKNSICKKGGLIGGAVIRAKATQKYKKLLGERFVKFHPAGEIIKDACISYVCSCGLARTASIMWKEIRNHKGKCPVCTGTSKKSSESLL